MEIKLASRSDAAAISRLLTQLSIDHIVGGFNAEGRANMLNSMTQEAIEGFFDEGFRYHVGVESGEIVAVVGTRNDSHLFHLFVADPHQGKGLASTLWDVAMQACLKSGNNSGCFTVNSSINAQHVYKHWGFKPIGGIREGGGVKDLPMKMEMNT